MNGTRKMQNFEKYESPQIRLMPTVPYDIISTSGFAGEEIPLSYEEAEEKEIW